MKITSATFVVLTSWVLSALTLTANAKFYLPGRGKLRPVDHVLQDEATALESLHTTAQNNEEGEAFTVTQMTQELYDSAIAFLIVADSIDSQKKKDSVYKKYLISRTYTCSKNLERALEVMEDEEGNFFLSRNGLRLGQMNEVHTFVQKALTALGGSAKNAKEIQRYIKKQFGYYFPVPWIESVFSQAAAAPPTPGLTAADLHGWSIDRRQQRVRYQLPSTPSFRTPHQGCYPRTPASKEVFTGLSESTRRLHTSRKETEDRQQHAFDKLVELSSTQRANSAKQRRAMREETIMEDEKHRAWVEKAASTFVQDIKEQQNKTEAVESEYRDTLLGMDELHGTTLFPNDTEESKNVDDDEDSKPRAKPTGPPPSHPVDLDSDLDSDNEEDEEDRKSGAKPTGPPPSHPVDSDSDSDADSDNQDEEDRESGAKPTGHPQSHPVDSDSDLDSDSEEDDKENLKPQANPTGPPQSHPVDSNSYVNPDSDSEEGDKEDPKPCAADDEIEYEHCRAAMKAMSEQVEDEAENDNLLEIEAQSHPCASCGGLIPGDAGYCSCGGARPMPEGGYKGWGGSNLEGLLDKKWKCEGCALFVDQDATQCPVCDHPGPAPTTEAPAPSTTANPTATGGFTFGFTPAAPAAGNPSGHPTATGGLTFGFTPAAPAAGDTMAPTGNQAADTILQSMPPGPAQFAFGIGEPIGPFYFGPTGSTVSSDGPALVAQPPTENQTGFPSETNGEEAEPELEMPGLESMDPESEIEPTEPPLDPNIWVQVNPEELVPGEEIVVNGILHVTFLGMTRRRLRVDYGAGDVGYYRINHALFYARREDH